MAHSWDNGQVSLDALGLGRGYFLGANEAEHSLGNGGVRSLLARAVDTHGDLSVLMTSGGESAPTMPHFHPETTECSYVLSGTVRFWMDDQNGHRVTQDVHAGEFALIPRNWIHAWCFAAPDSKQLGFIAPGGFERIVDFLAPDGPTSLERLRESEAVLDVRWMPEYPLIELCAADRAAAEEQ